MNPLLKLAETLEKAAAEARAIAGSPIVNAATQNDPRLAHLEPDGLWVPLYLTELVQKAIRRYGPDGRNNAGYNFETGQAGTAPVKWPNGFYASASLYDELGGLSRSDLTDLQKVTLQNMHNCAMPSAMTDSGHQLVYYAVDVVEGGGFRAALSTIYTQHPERLERDVRDYFRRLLNIE